MTSEKFEAASRSYRDLLGYRLLIASAIGMLLFHFLPIFASRVHSEAPLTMGYGWEVWTILPSDLTRAFASGDGLRILKAVGLLLLLLTYPLLTLGCCLAIRPLRQSRILRGLALFIAAGVNILILYWTYDLAERAKGEEDNFQILGYWLLPISLALSFIGLLFIKSPSLLTTPLES